MILRIKPMRAGKYIEPCMLEIKGELKDSEFYPVAVVHIDNFWQGREGGNQVYNLLQSEKVVEIEISLTPLAPDALRVCGKCGLSEQNHADHLCNPNYRQTVRPLGVNMVVAKSSQLLEVANRIISESRQLGDLSERDILVLQTGFQKLLRGLTPYTLDEGDSAALKELSDPNVFFSRED